MLIIYSWLIWVAVWPGLKWLVLTSCPPHPPLFFQCTVTVDVSESYQLGNCLFIFLKTYWSFLFVTRAPHFLQALYKESSIEKSVQFNLTFTSGERNQGHTYVRQTFSLSSPADFNFASTFRLTENRAGTIFPVHLLHTPLLY